MPPLESVAPTLATDTIYGHCHAFGKRPVSRAGAEFCKMFEASDELGEVHGSQCELRASNSGTILAIRMAA